MWFRIDVSLGGPFFIIFFLFVLVCVMLVLSQYYAVTIAVVVNHCQVAGWRLFITLDGNCNWSEAEVEVVFATNTS